MIADSDIAIFDKDTAKVENVRYAETEPPANGRSGSIVREREGVVIRAANVQGTVSVPTFKDTLLSHEKDLGNRPYDAVFSQELAVFGEGGFWVGGDRNSVYNNDPKSQALSIGANTGFRAGKMRFYLGGSYTGTFYDAPTFNPFGLEVPATMRETHLLMGNMTLVDRKTPVFSVLSLDYSTDGIRSEGRDRLHGFGFTVACPMEMGKDQEGSNLRLISSVKLGAHDGEFDPVLFTNSLEGGDFVPTARIGFGNNQIQLGLGLEQKLFTAKGGSGNELGKLRLGLSGLYWRDTRKETAKQKLDARLTLTFATEHYDLAGWLGNKSADYGTVKFVTNMGAEVRVYLSGRGFGQGMRESGKDEKYVQAESGLYLPKKREMKTKEGIFRQLCREVKAVDDAHKAGRSAYVKQGGLFVKSVR